jgi:hypothetical protein
MSHGERPRRPTPLGPKTMRELIPWRAVSPEGKELARWQHVDGRWVSLSFTDGPPRRVLVQHSDGRSQVTERYEEGLELAKTWRAGRA